MAKRKQRSHRPPDRKSGRTARPERRNLLWIHGLHPVVAALGNPVRQTQRLLATPEGLERLPDDIRDGLDKRAGLSVESAGRSDLDALLPGAIHQGLALQTAPLVDPALDDLLEKGGVDLLIALDHVTDPQNVGAILRSAAFYGAAGMILTDRHAPPETGALAKAAAGAVEMVPIFRVGNLAATLRKLQTAGFWCLGLDGDADLDLADADVSGPTVVVMGAEGDGLRRLTRDTCDLCARLPRPAAHTAAHLPAMDSLNVSNAAAVALGLVVHNRNRRNAG
jgi:23S rRNA (guanosine2251-2'-O)-methyltransferase